MRKPVLTAVLLGMALPSVLVPAVAAAAPGFDAQVAAYVDDADGTSVDVSAQLRPSDWLTLSIGGGQSSTSLVSSDFDGSSVHGGVAVTRGRFGAGLHASRWEDSGDFSSKLLDAEVSWAFADSLEVALLLEDRVLEVGYATTGPLGRPVPQTAEFDGTGFGARLGWYGREWSAWLSGMSYDYDDRLDRLVGASRAPGTRAFPRFAALVNSVLTRTAGAIDYQASLGVDRAFARSGLGADLMLSSDAISGADSTSLTLSYRYDLTARFGLDASVGMTDTEGLDTASFAGLGFRFRN